VKSYIIIYYYNRYSTLGLVWAEIRAQSGDWYGSGTLHPGQVLRGSLPLLSPCHCLCNIGSLSLFILLKIIVNIVKNFGYNKNFLLCKW